MCDPSAVFSHRLGMGPEPAAQGPNGKFVEMLIEMLTLVRDRDREQEPLFYCATPVPVLPPFSCSVKKTRRSL